MSIRTADPAPPPTPRRRRWRRAVVVLVVLVTLVVVALIGETARLTARIDHFDAPFAGLAERPTAPSADALDILLTSQDLVTVLHVSGDRRTAVWIWLPEGTGPDVGAVERLSGVRIDHVARVDHRLFEELQGRTGDDEDDPWSLPGTVAWPARTFAQQTYLRSVVRGTLHQELHRRPWQVHTLLETVTGHLAVDSSWSAYDLVRLSFSLWSFRSEEVRFVTAARGPSSAALWAAVRTDRISTIPRFPEAPSS